MGKTLDVAGALDVGRRADTLLAAHAARLAPRLAPTTAAELTRIIGVLEGSLAGIPGVRHEAKGATLTERQLAEQAAAAIGKLREMFKSKKLPAAQLKALGVGLEVDPSVTKSVVAAATAILNVATATGADLGRLGMKARDVVTLQTFVERLPRADSSQRSKKDASKSATSARDIAIERAYELAHQVGSAGAHEFSEAGSDPEGGEPPDAELEKVFQALVDDSVIPSDRARGKKKKPTDPPA